jgi:hypothetical protein
MDPFGQSLVSVPVLDVDGEVLALFQVALSKSSFSLFALSPTDPESSVTIVMTHLGK